MLYLLIGKNINLTTHVVGKSDKTGTVIWKSTVKVILIYLNFQWFHNLPMTSSNVFSLDYVKIEILKK